MTHDTDAKHEHIYSLRTGTHILMHLLGADAAASRSYTCHSEKLCFVSFLCPTLAAAAGAGAEDTEAGKVIEGGDSRSSTSTSSEVLPRPGTAMTAEGPVPFAGNILESPDVVWMDDFWTEEEVGFGLRLSRSLSLSGALYGGRMPFTLHTMRRPCIDQY